VKPKRDIRRFDVFAEYRKQDRQEAGDSEAVAKGYGLWVAKVVASRRFGGTRPAGGEPDGKDEDGKDGKGPQRQGEWHLLDGEPQTGALFDREIVARMGEDFYSQVFVPAIRDARAEGKSYEQIRDVVRRGWKV
jgi:hypothetical protein